MADSWLDYVAKPSGKASSGDWRSYVDTVPAGQPAGRRITTPDESAADIEQHMGAGAARAAPTVDVKADDWRNHSSLVNNSLSMQGWANHVPIPTLDRVDDPSALAFSNPDSASIITRRPDATAGNIAHGLGVGFTSMATQTAAGLEILRLQHSPLQGGETQAQRDDRIEQLHKYYVNAGAAALHADPQFKDDTSFLGIKPSDVYGAASSTLQSLPPIVGGIAAGALGGPLAGEAVGLGMAGLQQAGQSYPKYLERGGTPNQALAGAGLEGAFEVIGEKLPMDTLVHKFGKVGATKFLAEFFGKEMVGEQATTLAQNAVDTAIANPGKTWGQFYSEIPDQAYQTGLAVLMQSALLGGASHVTQKVGEAIDARGRIAARNPADTRTPGPSIAEQAIAAASQPTPEDIASPLDTKDIVAGHITIAEGQAHAQASDALSQANMPPLGSRVQIHLPDGSKQHGTMGDYFTGEDGDGVHVHLDSGKPFREYLDTLNDTGTRITATTPEEAQAMAEAQQVVDQIAQQRPPAPVAQTPALAGSAPAAEPVRSAGVTHPTGGGLDPHIVEFFTARGYSPAQARGIAAGIEAEGGLRQQTGGGYKGRALGIGQWLGPRKAAIIAQYGEHPTLDQQLEFMHSELQGGDVGGKHVLAQHDEAGVLDAYIKKFMRPAAGHETSGDIERGMAALGRPGEAPAAGTVAENATAATPDAPLPTTEYGDASASAAPGEALPAPAKRTDEPSLEGITAAPAPAEPLAEARRIAQELVERGHSTAGFGDGYSYSFGQRMPGSPAGPHMTPGKVHVQLESDRSTVHTFSLADLQRSAPVVPASTPRGETAAPRVDDSASPGPSLARIEAGRTDKSIAIVGATPEQLAAIAEAIPQAKPSPPRADGAIIYSAKYRDEIQTALDKSQVGTGEAKGAEFQAFPKESGTLGIPRAEMPQIKAEHRGAMVNFLNARGIEHSEETVPASSLKPTQAEFSPEKVLKATVFEGGDRAILISQDNHVVDGHHQWLAAAAKGEDVRAIKLHAPIRDVLEAAHEFPSSTTADGATEAKPATTSMTRTEIADAYAKMLGHDRSKFHEEIADAIINRNAYGLKNLANGLNEKGKRIFTMATGIKLPKGQADTWRALREWGGISDEQDARDAGDHKAKVESDTRARDRKFARNTAASAKMRTASGEEMDGATWLEREVGAGFNKLVNTSRGAAPKYALVNAEGRGYPIKGDLLKYAKHLVDEAKPEEPSEKPEPTRNVGAKKKGNANPTLIEWIADRGGIWDGHGKDSGGKFKGGDLKAIGLGDWHNKAPFRRKAIRDPKLGHGDRGIDNTLTDAIEAGFFPELEGSNDGYYGQLDGQILIDAIDAELAGRPRYSKYTNTAEPDVSGTRTPDEGELEHYAELIGEVAQKQFGVEPEDLDPKVLARAAQIKFDSSEGMTDAEAFMHAVNELMADEQKNGFARTHDKSYEGTDYDWPHDSEHPGENLADGDNLAGQAPAGQPEGERGQAGANSAQDHGETGGVSPGPATNLFGEPLATPKPKPEPTPDLFGGTAGDAVDPNVAKTQGQQAQLGAAAPLQGGIKTGLAQDGTMGAALFDHADQTQLGGLTPAKPSSYGASNKVFTADAAEKARATLRAKLKNQLNSGFDPEIAQAGLTLMGYHIESGARAFMQAAHAVAADLGMTPADLKGHLRSWYSSARNYFEDNGHNVDGMDEDAAVKVDLARIDQWGKISAPAAQESETAPAPAATPEKAEPGSTPVETIANRLVAGERFASIVEARKALSELTGETIKPGTPEAKRADETIEAAVVQAARKIAAKGLVPHETFRALVDLYDRQPNLNVRSSTSIEQQAYSTPVPLAYLASQRAGINQNTRVYEPSAGNGALLIDARATYVTANELNPDRAAMLRQLYRGATITEGDAMADNLGGNQFDAVIANPPFGPVKDADGDTRIFDMGGGYETREIDHAIAMFALHKMKDGGRATLIVGGINKLANTDRLRSAGYSNKAKREFYYRLYSEYNVTDHFTVAGELYAKQGAGWPVDVIVIEGRGKSSLPLPAVSPPRQYASWAELENTLDGRPGLQSEAGAANGSADSTVGQPGGFDGRDSQGGRAGRPGRQQQLSEPSQPGDVRQDAAAGQPGGGRLDERPAVVSTGLHAGAAENNGNRATGRPSQVTAAPIEGENARQVAYNPASSSKSLDTLVPVNMQTAITAALNKLQDAVGKVDDFVADRLGYQSSEIPDYFSAEQVDALALALDNMEKGAGFIIGDQTGIGKGRVVAGIIRYAIKSGRTPIFVTEKPNLYADMYRDMSDIGLPEMLGRPVNILMTNAGETVPLDEDGKQVLKTPTAGKHNDHLMRVANGDREGVDVVFTNYSQMQTLKGETTPRQAALSALAPGSILIFDESHNAGGQGKQGDERKTKKQKEAEEAGLAPMNRAQFARALAAQAHGVFFSSATYAKRPDVMDLYASTDMRLAVANIDNLAAAISKGGIPMQQVVATMLTEAGQYVRRERSFEGVDYRTPRIEVDRKAYAQFAQVLRGIQQFQEMHIAEAVEAISEEIKTEAAGISFDGSIGSAGAHSTNFTSVMHNLVEQMLVALKAEPAVAMAIEAIKHGEKPVITLANTMGSFIQQYADDNELGNGGEMPSDFRAMLVRYLDRTRHYTVKKPFSKEKGEKKYISDAELGADGLMAYRAVEKQIEQMALQDVPISPIDHIRNRLAEAGYKVGEITGRTHTIDYSGGFARLRIRPGSEKSIAGKLKAMSGFNNGTIDAMILNQSGSTGLSLHASEKFKDQRPRRMIIAQAERNIDTHMQMLGRIHRTGQVVLPSYDQLVAAVPAELRPAAVLAKKMASLNANTTGARGSAMTAEDVPDFMNEYGDEIAARMMEEDPVLHKALLGPLQTSKGSAEGLEREDAARKVTGKLTLMPLEEQEAFYDTFLSEYRTYLAEKEAAGEASLEAKTLDLDAKLVDGAQVIGPTDSSSPFGAAVNREVFDVKRLGKPMAPAQVLAEVAKTIGEPAPEGADTQALLAIEPKGKAWSMALYRERMAEFDAYRREVMDGLEGDKVAAHAERLQANSHAFSQLTDALYPGSRVAFSTPAGFEFHGIVTSLEKKGSTKNPLALGSWRAVIALADPARTMTIPLSQLRTNRMPESPTQSDIGTATHAGLVPILQAFEDMQTESREQRTIFTGNILAAFEHTAGKGQIVNFVTSEGAVRPGIMMRRGYDYAKEIARQPVPFRTPEQVLAWIKQGEIAFADGIKVEHNAGQLVVTAAASKAAGGRYFLNAGVRQALGGDFYKKSTGMVAETSMRDAGPVIAALQRAGATFTAETNFDKARDIVANSEGVKESRPDVRAFTPNTENTRNTENTGSLDAVAADLLKQLKAMGLEGKVALHIRNAMFRQTGAQGAYWPGQRVMEVALDAKDGHSFVLNHEVIHALLDMGAISKTDRMILAQAARAHPEIWKSVSRRYPNLGFTAREEEAIADLNAIYQRGDYTPKGAVERALMKVIRFLSAVRNALHGQGFTSTRTFREVLDEVASGKAAARVDTQATAPTFGKRGLVSESQFSIPEREQMVDLAGSDPTWKGQMRERFDGWRTRMQDRYLPLLRTQSEIEAATGKTLPARMNPYLGEELMTGRIGARLESLADDHVEPLFDAMHAEKVSLDELETYLYARHAPERNARIAEINPELEGNGSGMTDLEAMAVMKRVEREGKMDAMERLAARVDALRDMALDTRVESGLMSKAQAAEWRSTYEHYVPLRGFKETEGEATDSQFAERINRSGGGINVRGRESKPAFGRRSQADSPVAYTILQAEEAIVRGETNRVAQRFINLARANPDDAFWQVNKVTVSQGLNKDSGLVERKVNHNITAADKDWTVSAKFNGKEVRVTMNRQNKAAARLADSMRNLTQHQLDWVTQHLGKVNRFLSAVNTSFNPEFIVTNAFRDLQTAAINLAGVDVKGLETKVLKSYPAALKASLAGAFGKESGEWGDAYHEFTQAGGRVYFNRVENVDQIKERIEKLARQSGAKLGEGGARLQAQRAFNAVKDAIENANLGVENAVRLATYKAAREAGLSQDRAASLAKNVTVNFNRRGTFGPAMNSAYLFYNAGAQGTARLMQAVRSPRVRKMLAGVMVTGFLVELLNGMIAGDDDDGQSFYDKISPSDKERNFIVAIGGSKFIKLPMPYGYNVFYNAGRTAGEVLRHGGKNWQDSGANFLSSAFDAFNPVGGSSSLLNFFAPTVLDWVVDLKQNRNFTGRPIMPDQNPFESPVPDHERYFSTVSPYWKAVTEFLNTASGGDSVVPGKVDVSPETLQYLSGTALGAAGAFVQTIGTDFAKGTSSGSISDEGIGINDIPFARKVVGDKPGWFDKSAYYDRQAQIQQALTYTKEYAAGGQMAEAQDFVDHNRKVLTMLPLSELSAKQLSEVRKGKSANDLAHDHGKIDAATYRDNRQKLADAEKAIITRFNTGWNAAINGTDNAGN